MSPVGLPKVYRVVGWDAINRDQPRYAGTSIVSSGE
jgi:hypothetical protein